MSVYARIYFAGYGVDALSACRCQRSREYDWSDSPVYLRRFGCRSLVKVKIDCNTIYSHREDKMSLGKSGHGPIDGLAAETWVKPVTSWLYSGQSVKRVRKYVLRRTCGDHRCSPWDLSQRVQDMFFTVFQSLSHREYSYFYCHICLVIPAWSKDMPFGT